MKNYRGTVGLTIRLLLLPATAFLATLNPATAQQTANTVSPADLARYDTNRNGVLDADEIAARQADQARAAGSVESGAPSAASAARDEAVQLSPFEVKEDTNGYFASNTMSGTRLNTRIEDLAASVSVVTKQQMADFAMLDINDIFSYESGTEGTGQFTAFEVD